MQRLPQAEEKEVMPTTPASFAHVQFEVSKSKTDKQLLQVQAALPTKDQLMKLAAKLTFKLVLVPFLGPASAAV